MIAPARLARAARRPADTDVGSSPVELALVMAGVMTLLVVTLGLGMRWLAVQAAEASAQRALEIMQSPDGTPEESAAVAGRLARSSRSITSVTTTVQVAPEQVTVTVTVTSVLGMTVARSAFGPRLRFVPQPMITYGAPVAGRGGLSTAAPPDAGVSVPAGAGRTP
jgi:hypothetical protein